MSEIIEYKGHEIKLMPDENADSPREWDNLGKMVCFHSSYVLGDKHSLTTDEVKDILDRKDVIALPLYLYEHGGITMSCEPFSCPWDSGQVGIIYVDYETLKKEYSVKKITPKIREKARQVLIGEVETYDQYLTGDVWGWETCEESVWGFFGSEDALQEAKNHVDWVIQDNLKKKLEHTKTMIKNHVPLDKREMLTI